MEIRKFAEKHRDLIFAAEKYIWENPETGYRENKANDYLIKKFTGLGYDVVPAEGITGFYAVYDTGKPGPTVLVLGELDSVICPTHPSSDIKTGAVHACGHNVQCAALLGLAAALKEKGAADGLCGKVKLCAVPAEELLEIGYRKELIKQGKIKYLGGKSEFLSRGYFDDVDVAFMVHVATSSRFAVGRGTVGIIAKEIEYKGVAAHAGGSPWDGVNALYAATCGINAANAVRETCAEPDIIRFHPIITHGGEVVNTIPDRVTVESYVRGANYPAIIAANKRFNRALIGGALSLGATIKINDMCGYAPMLNDPEMINVAKEAAALAIPEEEFVYYDSIDSGSTDMGDLSCIMPVVHPYAGGAVGSGHGSNYFIEDREKACIKNVAFQLAMVRLLLCDGGKRAKAIKENYKPLFASKEQFLAFQDSINSSEERITYTEDRAEIKL